MNTFKQIGLVLALALSSSITANAAVLYNNIPANLSSVIDGQGIGGEGNFYASKFAASNLCPSGCTLGNITLNLSSSDSSSAGFQLQVVSSDGTGNPGAKLITLNNPDTFTTDFGNNLFTTPIPNFNLVAGTDYWLKFISASNNGLVYWSTNNSPTQTAPNQPQQFVYDFGGGIQRFTNPGLLMKVEVSPNASVPLPGGIWIMGSGLIMLVSSWRKKALG